MSHTYYSLYNEVTLDLISISGSLFTDIPNGMMICKVYEKDGEAFNTGKKYLHEYLVTVNEDGYAEFKHKYLHAILRRFNDRDVIAVDVVQDLNYKTIFFDYLNIKFTYNNNNLTLTFDQASLDENKQENFKLSVNKENSKCRIFVTDYQDPTKLITNFNLDIYDLSVAKTFTQSLTMTNAISLWGIRI